MGEYVYMGPVGANGVPWQKAHQNNRVDGIFYLKDRIDEILERRQ